MNGVVLMNDCPGESAFARSYAHTWQERTYCIACAISTPDFKERAPLSHPTPFDGSHQARAWIHGRGYQLLGHPTAKVICIGCGREVAVAYVPEDRHIL